MILYFSGTPDKLFNCIRTDNQITNLLAQNKNISARFQLIRKNHILVELKRLNDNRPSNANVGNQAAFINEENAKTVKHRNDNKKQISNRFIRVQDNNIYAIEFFDMYHFLTEIRVNSIKDIQKTFNDLLDYVYSIFGTQPFVSQTRDQFLSFHVNRDEGFIPK